MTILEKIITYKKKEYANDSVRIPVRELEKSKLFNREVVSLSQSLTDLSKSGIIAEFKRKSPSKGMINSEASVIDVTGGYFREGASGVSVLTDNEFFGGSSDDLVNARSNSFIPILRKDFIIGEYQVIESKAIGADVVLLIAAVLGKYEILNLARLANSFGMEVLLEIHDQKELEMVNQYVKIIGINNRNLKTFKVDTDTSVRLADKIPAGFLKISESGITSPEIIKRLRLAGFNGFLIGERFMASPDPANSFAEFVKLIYRNHDQN